MVLAIPAPKPLADLGGGKHDTVSQISCFLGGHKGRELGHLLGGWGQDTQAASPALPLTRCDLGPAVPPLGFLVYPALRKVLVSTSLRQGQWSVLREARKGGHTQHGVVHRETPTLGGVGGVCREVLEAGLSCLGITRAEQAPQLQQNQGVLQAEVPKASRVTGALSRGAPGSGMREGREDRGQRCSGLGPASITGCLSDPGPVTLTSAGLFPQP